MEEELWTIKDVSKYLKLCYQTIWNRIKSGFFVKDKHYIVLDVNSKRKVIRFYSEIIKNMKG